MSDYAIKMILSFKDFKRRFNQSGTYAVEHQDDDRLWKIVMVDDYNQLITLVPTDESEYKHA
jgi:hypothetical protein